MSQELSPEAKEDIAFSMILLKDFKSQGKMDVGVSTYVIKLVDHLGVREEFDKLLAKIPPMRIEER